MRAAEHNGVDRGQIVLVEILVQRAHHHIMVVKLPMLHDLHQTGAGLRKNRMIGLEPVHQHGELAFTQRQGSGGHDDALTLAVTTVASHLQCRLHADDRNVVCVAQFVGCGGSGGIAGDHDRFHALFHESFHNDVGQFAHLFGRFRAVWSVRGVAEIQHMFVRHVAADLTRHGDSSQAGIENADRCR